MDLYDEMTAEEKYKHITKFNNILLKNISKRGIKKSMKEFGSYIMWELFKNDFNKGQMFGDGKNE